MSNKFQRVSRKSVGNHSADTKSGSARSPRECFLIENIEPSNTNASQNSGSERRFNDAQQQQDYRQHTYAYHHGAYPRSRARRSQDTRARKQPSTWVKKLPLIAGLVIALGLIGVFIFFQFSGTTPHVSDSDNTESLVANDTTESNQLPVVPQKPITPTPLVAEYKDILIHLPVSTQDLTEVVFHQASTSWALKLNTQLPDGDVETMQKNHGSGRSSEQPIGDNYLKGSVLHLWRTTAYTDMDTSVDCGAPIGSTVYAPVSGTVTKVRTYTLERTLEDYCVHIQPEGHPELDMCVIHITDVCVEVGDHVTGGETPIAKVRDIESYLSGIQLEPYTPQGDGGNHAHIQMNDVNYPDYPYSDQ